MKHPDPDTIFALSSGRPPSGVAVIRVSGPAAVASLRAIAGDDVPPRMAALRTLRAGDGGPIDRALVLRFTAPASFTGEDSVEYQVHGGPAVVAALLDVLARQPHHRLAGPGEFSLRAFLNGKADLTEVEALADLISAETEAQRKLAVTQASGAQRHLYEGWRSELLRLRALIEADLDFSDEDDVPGSVADAVVAASMALGRQVQAHLATARSGEVIRDGFKVVLAGPPNAGKSSLLNALARREAAIVTAIPGTTRDAITVDLDLHGYRVSLTDTAGLRAAEDAVEEIGIRRARNLASEAHLVLALSEDGTFRSPDAAEQWIVRTKDDAGAGAGGADHAVSAVTGAGLAGLSDALARAAADASVVPGDGLVVTRLRHVRLLEDAAAHLGSVGHAQQMGGEFVAEALRRAADSLGRITGRMDVEDVLGEIFSSFCIGK